MKKVVSTSYTSIPSTEGSKYQAWSPILGYHDIRWASQLPPFIKEVTVDEWQEDLDEDLDEIYQDF